ncbi:MAG: leucine-rich repeat domain-containing protein [Paludibacteraceae bacterium]|nr:leucine-rich repeat domain-containing protein [Paludibacteraceae bacterium]
MVKRLLCIIAVLCMSLQLFAYDFSVVNSDGVTIYYTITSSTAPLTVEVVKNGVNTYSGEVNIPSTVTHGGNTYSVTSIGVDAFYPCSGLTKVTIPNSVLNIRTRAFYMCM